MEAFERLLLSGVDIVCRDVSFLRGLHYIFLF